MYVLQSRLYLPSHCHTTKRSNSMLAIRNLRHDTQQHLSCPAVHAPAVRTMQAPGTPDRWLVAEVELPAAAPPAGQPLLEFVVADAGKSHWDKPQSGGWRRSCGSALTGGPIS